MAVPWLRRSRLPHSPAEGDYNRSSGVGKENVVLLLCLSFRSDMGYFKKIASKCKIAPQSGKQAKIGR